MKLNQVAHLQTEVAHAYMREYNLKPADFVEFDCKYGILRFIENGYEPFHLTGTQGIIGEIDDYVRSQREHRSKGPGPRETRGCKPNTL